MTLRITDVEDNTTGWKLEFYQFLHIHLKHGIKMEKSTSKKNKKIYIYTLFFTFGSVFSTCESRESHGGQ